MKKFFKKLVGKDTSDSTQASAAEASQNFRQQEESKTAEQAQQVVRSCADGIHRQANFKCWNDHCQAILCFACAR